MEGDAGCVHAQPFVEGGWRGGSVLFFWCGDIIWVLSLGGSLKFEILNIVGGGRRGAELVLCPWLGQSKEVSYHLTNTADIFGE